jgi:hypothetical protein
MVRILRGQFPDVNFFRILKDKYGSKMVDLDGPCEYCTFLNGSSIFYYSSYSEPPVVTMCTEAPYIEQGEGASEYLKG